MCKTAEFALFLLAVSAVLGSPVKDELMFDMGGDTAVVESTVRETRAAPDHIADLIKPGVKTAYLHVYGNANKDDGDEQGYHKRTKDRNADGYKHFDSYHKKDSDKYGFEKHSEYGKADHADTDAKSEKSSQKEDESEEGGETRNTYAIVEEPSGKSQVQGAESYQSAAEGDHYGGGGSGSYSEGEGESSSYSDGDSGSYSEGDGESSSYEEGDGDGESSSYTAEGDGESEGYATEEKEEEEGDY